MKHLEGVYIQFLIVVNFQVVELGCLFFFFFLFCLSIFSNFLHFVFFVRKRLKKQPKKKND